MWPGASIQICPSPTLSSPGPWGQDQEEFQHEEFQHVKATKRVSTSFFLPPCHLLFFLLFFNSYLLSVLGVTGTVLGFVIAKLQNFQKLLILGFSCIIWIHDLWDTSKPCDSIKKKKVIPINQEIKFSKSPISWNICLKSRIYRIIWRFRLPAPEGILHNLLFCLASCRLLIHFSGEMLPSLSASLSNNKCWLFHNLCGAGIWAWLSWVSLAPGLPRLHRLTLGEDQFSSSLTGCEWDLLAGFWFSLAGGWKH